MAFFTFASRYFRPALLLGLDFDHSTIRMVELSQRADRSFRLERYAQRALPEGTVTDEHIHHPGRLAEHIAALAQHLGTRRKRVALALPAHAVMTRQMQVPADISGNALNALITAEAGRYLTVASGDVRVDYQFMRAEATISDDIADTDRTDQTAPRDILLAAARKEQVEDRIAAVEAAGLIPAVLDIDLYAAHAACIHAMTGLPTPSVLIMLGASPARIALFDRHQLLFHRELPGCDAGADAMQVAVAATRAIQLATPAGMSVRHIFIGGDRIAQESLAPVLQEYAGINCISANPLAAMPRRNRHKKSGQPGPEQEQQDKQARTASNPDDEYDPATYLVACGLAMREVAR